MELNRKYLLRILIDNRLLTYTGTIISIDDMFVKFRDRFEKEISVNKNTIQSFEEVSR